MKLEINKIYKVKKGHEGKCSVFEDKGHFVEYLGEDAYWTDYFNILDKDKKLIVDCQECFTEDDLEPLEEETQFKRGDLVEVSEHADIMGWVERIYLGELKGDKRPYVCVEYSDNEAYLINDVYAISNWKHIRPLKVKKQLTKKEIANKFNLNEDEIEII